MKIWNSSVTHYSSADQTFRYHHGRDEYPNQDNFKPHYESGYELYMFISGSGSYTVEGSKYELEPLSLLMIHSNELHVLNISEKLPYERIVFTISPSFLPPLMTNGVDLFRTIKYRKPGQGNQIPAEEVKSSGLLDLIKLLETQYLVHPNEENDLTAKCILVQILVTINRIRENTGSLDQSGSKRTSDPKVKAMLEFINANLDSSLSLNELADRFYITKYHLCRIFKAATGFSVNQYITYKRILMADSLMLEGNTPTQACYASGFNCYSSFFKAYRKLTGKSPRPHS